jgi:hypothetical protein
LALALLIALTADFAALRLTVPVFAELLTVRWDNALAAADFSALEARGSRRVLPAADAEAAEVWRLGELVCESALPAAARAWALLVVLLTTLEDFVAAALPVTFGFVTRPYASSRHHLRASFADRCAS